MSETNDQRIYDRCLIRVGELEAENAKLREQIHWLKQGDILHVLTDQEYIDQSERERLMQVSIDALDKENAKLRELVRDMWEYVKDYADALDAEVYGQVWPTVKHGYGDKVRNGLGEFVGFPDRMRELGIEVG